MKGWIKVLVFNLLTFPFVVNAQSSAALKKQQNQIRNEIKKLNSILQDIDVDKKKTDIQIIISQKKIGAREELIQSISNEVGVLEQQIIYQKSLIDSLSFQLSTLRNQYKKMVVHAYKNRNATDKLIFIFSSNDFNQAYKRIKYINEIGEFRVHQVKQIEEASEKIKEQIVLLENKKKDKVVLIEVKNLEKTALQKEEENLKQLYQNIQQNEKKIKADILAKQKEDQKLNEEIKRIIQREIEEAQRKAEEARKKKTEAERLAREKAIKEGKTPPPAPKKVDDVYKQTPDAKLLSDNFIANKGNLPWPVDKATVSVHFGNSKHPVYKELEIINNGINILTTRNSDVKCIFNGNVSAVIALPNGKNAVLVQHGDFFTLYSNLSNIKVKRNDAVKTGDVLGVVKTDEDGKTELHFELWQGKITQNPEAWLLRL
jgi:septal ring factor EnvC (AmiA/AmiB activator)